MGYTTAEFEKAANEKGYVIESIRKRTPEEVDSVRGSVIEGSLVKQVRWDAEGKCFSFRCKPLRKHDLNIKKEADDEQAGTCN